MRDVILFSLFEIIYTILLIYFLYIDYFDNTLMFPTIMIWVALTINTIALKESFSKNIQ